MLPNTALKGTLPLHSVFVYTISYSGVNPCWTGMFKRKPMETNKARFVVSQNY